MLNKPDSLKKLQKLFLKQPIVDMSALFKILQTKSRMSIFRRLKGIGYFSSFTHAGKYYTLTNTPQFDDKGLWFHQEIGFSQFGTLKATIIELVCGSSAGLTHLELSQLLRIKVYNSLLDLAKEGQIGRERIDKSLALFRFVWVSDLFYLMTTLEFNALKFRSPVTKNVTIRKHRNVLKPLAFAFAA